MAEPTAFEIYGPKAREEHIQFVDSFVPGFRAFSLDTDIHLGIWNKTMHAGVYFLKAGDDAQTALVYTVVFDPQQLEQIADDAKDYDEYTNEEGKRVRAIRDETQINITMEPLEVQEGRYLSFLEAVTWTAITTAENDEIRDAIFKSAYKVVVEEPEGEEGEPLPKQDTVKPRTQVDPNSKLANKITNLANGETVNLDVSGTQEKKAVTTVVTLEYEGEGIELAKPMTQYDREVHNAVTTLWKAGNTSFTARQVWHTLTGTDVKSPPSREQMARIEESIDKQRFTRAMVDFTEEARGRELTLDGESVTSYKIDAYMLNAEKHTIETANGRTVEGYTITRPPVLYQHASMLGQVITYPMRYLAAGSVGQNSEENIVIRKYLLRRIWMAKGKGHVSKRIKYSSVYEKAGIAEPDKKQRKRINDLVVSCLEALAKEGAIKGFTEYKEGRARAGVDLIV